MNCEPRRVLIVDDDERDFRSIRDLLAHDGRRAGEWGPSYAAGLTALVNGAYSVCIVDFELEGGQSGLEFAREALARGVTTPLILLSGHEWPTLAEEVQHVGMDDYLPKWRLTPDILERSIRYAVDRARMRAHIVAQDAAVHEARRHAMAMSRLAALGRLVAGVAHDFNNIVTVIAAEAQQLERSLSADDPRHMLAHDVVSSSKRAIELTRQLVEFSRKRTRERRVVDLNGVILDLDHMLRRLIRDDVALVTEVGPEQSLVINDTCQLEQILLNLVLNARDAMPTGGRVSIETRPVVVEKGEPSKTGLPPGDYVMLVVADDGIGMTDDVRARIFEPFFTTREVSGGTGLGLSTVRDLVESSGGAIAVHSESGRGSTFEVFLPRVPSG